MLMVIAPTHRELGGLAPGPRGELLVAVTGLGKSSTLISLERLLKQNRPAALISLGFAGGLTPAARPGDLALCEKAVAVGEDTRKEVALDRGLLEQAEEVARKAGLACRRGALATVASPLFAPVAKKEVAQQTGAFGVDMEGYWVAQKAEAAGVPCLVLRAIVDPVEADLPGLVQRIVADRGRHEVLHTLRYLMGGPWRGPQVLRLAVWARRASRSLESAVRDVVLPLSGTLALVQG